MARTSIIIEDSIIKSFRKIGGRNDTERMLGLLDTLDKSNARSDLLYKSNQDVLSQLERITIAMKDLNRRMEEVDKLIQSVTGKSY